MYDIEEYIKKYVNVNSLKHVPGFLKIDTFQYGICIYCVSNKKSATYIYNYIRNMEEIIHNRDKIVITRPSLFCSDDKNRNMYTYYPKKYISY